MNKETASAVLSFLVRMLELARQTTFISEKLILEKGADILRQF